jgi:hypothetical protein
MLMSKRKTGGLHDFVDDDGLARLDKKLGKKAKWDRDTQYAEELTDEERAKEGKEFRRWLKQEEEREQQRDNAWKKRQKKLKDRLWPADSKQEEQEEEERIRQGEEFRRERLEEERKEQEKYAKKPAKPPHVDYGKLWMPETIEEPKAAKKSSLWQRIKKAFGK